MNKTIFITGIVFGILAVILGAFGAHGLEKLVGAEAVRSFETGVTYQMYHALLLLVLGSVNQIPERSKRPVYYLVTMGVLLFSFSIYFLATNTLTAIDFSTIGFITPIGGTLLIAGWAWLGLGCLRHFN